MSLKNSLYQLVGHSSLHYLSQHMYLVYSDIQILLDFFGEVLHKNWDGAQEHREKMLQLTQEARQLTRRADKHLGSDLFAPVLRTQIIRLLEMQTRMANKALSITGLVMARHLEMPPSLGVEFFPMLNKSIAAIYQTYHLMNRLEEIAGTQEGETLIHSLNQMVLELDKLENETDQGEVLARQALFSLESELDPINVLALYKMLEWCGELADQAHDFGGSLVSMFA